LQVEYIQYIKAIPSEEGRNAELALYRRQPNEAERILLQASPPLIFRAVMMNIHQYRWARALEIAVKYRSHVDTCLGYRQRFLEQFGRRETDQRFLQYANQVTVDWDAIRAKKQKELDDEMMRHGGGGSRK
jgi:intraflagellar transport protein 80